MEENPQIQKEYYVAFIGERSVGKTSIINRYKGEKYDENVQSTQRMPLLLLIKKENGRTHYTLFIQKISL